MDNLDSLIHMIMTSNTCPGEPQHDDIRQYYRKHYRKHIKIAITQSDTCPGESQRCSPQDYSRRLAR
jgi:hypothetical protein